MKKTLLTFVSLTAVSFLMSCVHEEEPVAEPLKIVSEALSDSTSFWGERLRAYSNDNRMGDIAVIGSAEDAVAMGRKLTYFDNFDNCTGRPESDMIPDFSGETIEIFADTSLEGSYDDFIREGNTEALRTQFVSMAISAVSDKVDSSRSGTLAKAPAKMLVLSSGVMSDYGLSDINGMFDAGGLDVMVTDVRGASRRYVFSRHSPTCGYAIWSPLKIEDAVDEFAAFLASQKLSKPYSAIVIDDGRAPEIIRILNGFVSEIKSSDSGDPAGLRGCFAPDFEFVDAFSAVAEECFGMLRSNGKLTMKIAYPQSRTFSMMINKDRLYVFE